MMSVVKFIYNGSNNKSLCWWCSEKICQKVSCNSECICDFKYIPTKYDSNLNTFYTYGKFCSWECAKAFNLNINKTPSEKHTLFTLMVKKIYGKYTKIYPAPHWSELEKYGGNKSINDFIENKINDVTNNNIIKLDVAYSKPEKIIKEKIEYTKQKQIEDYVLKRTKPLKGQKNTLEKTMGLIIGNK